MDINIVSAPEVPDYWGIVEMTSEWSRCIPIQFKTEEEAQNYIKAHLFLNLGSTYRVVFIRGR